MWTNLRVRMLPFHARYLHVFEITLGTSPFMPPWKYKPEKPGSVPCNAEILRFFRNQRGWTQEDLANFSRCSPRVVAKAEKGDNVKADTLEAFSDALSTPAVTVHPEDLAMSPQSLVMEFLNLYAQYEHEVVAKCRHFLAEHMSAFVAGDPKILPFAGEWSGIDGFDQLWRAFFKHLVRPDKTLATRPVKLVSQGNTAMALIYERVNGPGLPQGDPVPVTLLFTFERARIVRFEDHFDHHSAAESYQRLIQRMQSPEGDATD